jgi:hypothetical protein
MGTLVTSEEFIDFHENLKVSIKIVLLTPADYEELEKNRCMNRMYFPRSAVLNI